jgi:glycosyltransferase involved in cell wall biosynthesis
MDRLAAHALARADKPDTASATDPLVTVVVAACNAEGTVEETLISVAAQRYRNLEILVVDGGSSDATAAIADEFRAIDDRFVLLRQPNKGVAAARNAGLTRARVCL